MMACDRSNCCIVFYFNDLFKQTKKVQIHKIINKAVNTKDARNYNIKLTRNIFPTGK